MTGQSQSTWMGNALTIDQHRIRQAGEVTKGRQQHRQFTKGQQTRHIGKSFLPTDPDLLPNHHFRQFQHYNRTEQQGIPASAGYIHGSDPSHGTGTAPGRFGADPARQSFLQSDVRQSPFCLHCRPFRRIPFPP